jgi:hypothetical protein
MSGAAAAAAAEAARRMREEEEEMTPYSKSDLDADYEFKIIRSTTGVFKHPEKMRAILEEEARAGWVLVEKFDNSRIRLKRPANARAGDADLDFDPYRTSIGLSEGRLVGIILGVIFGTIALIILLGILLANRR